jgi:hypothetical protein
VVSLVTTSLAMAKLISLAMISLGY